MVWVTEIWRSKTDHQASLRLEVCRAFIQQTMPLLAKVATVKLQPIGGIGL